MVHRPRIVIIGAGFAGHEAARTMARLARDRADITIVNPTDYFLYLPLLPEVAAGLLEPRRVTVSLPARCPACGWCSGRWTRSTSTGGPSSTSVRRATAASCRTTA